MSTRDIEKEEIIKAFEGYNFGVESFEDKKAILIKSLKARATGFHTGATITHIMLGLGLVKFREFLDDDLESWKEYHLTEKGLNYLANQISSQPSPEKEEEKCKHPIHYQGKDEEGFEICTKCGYKF